MACNQEPAQRGPCNTRAMGPSHNVPPYGHIGSLTTCTDSRITINYPISPYTCARVSRDDVTKIELVATQQTAGGPVQWIKINSDDDPANFIRLNRWRFMITWMPNDTWNLPGGNLDAEVHVTTARGRFLAERGRLTINRLSSQSLASVSACFETDINFLTVNLDASCSSTVHSTATGTGFPTAQYDIDWGDGNTDVSTTPTISHTYIDEGKYTITLKVTAEKDDPANLCEPLLTGETAKVVCLEIPIP